METENLAFIWNATALRKLVDKGVTVTALAKHFGVSRTTVYKELGKPDAPAKTNGKAPGPHESTGAGNDTPQNAPASL